MRGFALLLSLVCCGLKAETRDWTVADSVEQRYFQTNRLHPYDHTSKADDVAWFSRNGERFFVISFRGDLAADQTVYEMSIYSVADVAEGLREGGKSPGSVKPLRIVRMRSGASFLHTSSAIYLPEWQGNDVITFVGTEGKDVRSVYRYEIASGELRALTEPQYRIADSGGGEYTVRGATTMFKTYDTEKAVPDYPFQVLTPERLYYMAGGDAQVNLDATHWRFRVSYKGAPSKLVAEGHLNYSRGSYIGGPWISPDERWAVLLYRPDGWETPASWSQFSIRTPALWYMLIDLQSGVSRPLSDEPLGMGRISTSGSYGMGTAHWSADSEHVLLSNLLLPGRSRTSYFIDHEVGNGRNTVVDTFAVTGQVLADASWIEEGKTVAVELQGGDRRGRRYRYDGRQWKSATLTSLAPAKASSSRLSIEVRQSADELPQLVASDSRASVVLSTPDAQQSLWRAQTERIRWTDSSGKPAEGVLRLPKGFSKGNGTPVVVEFLNTSPDVFAPDGMPGSCDVAQSLVSQGLVVFQLVAAGGYGVGRAVDPTLFQTPQEFPAQVSLLDSAMEMLKARGIASDAPIGVTGFSRTGAYVYYIVTHPARTRVGAAIVCDAITNSFGEYLSLAGTHGADETRHFSLQFGNGKSFWENKQGWLDAPEFNLERSRAPVLFHTHGNPALYPATETMGALLLARRPFEFHYYPDAGHALTIPRQQAAAMQSTIDWMRFWLQGYERETPDDPERFSRWRSIRSDWESVLMEEKH